MLIALVIKYWQIRHASIDEFSVFRNHEGSGDGESTRGVGHPFVIAVLEEIAHG